MQQKLISWLKHVIPTYFFCRKFSNVQFQLISKKFGKGIKKIKTNQIIVTFFVETAARRQICYLATNEYSNAMSVRDMFEPTDEFLIATND